MVYNLRWLTHLCTWNPVSGVVVTAAGRSPAWQLGPGVEEDEREEEEEGPNTIYGEPLVLAVVFGSIPSLCFLWKGLPLRDIKATRVALIP